MKALIFENRVVQLEETPFEVHEALFWVDAPDGTEYGDVYEDGVIKKPTVPLEIHELRVRAERNRLLSTTDWTQAADIPQATKDLWAPYRQELRDIPQQEGFPTDVIWPVAPA